MSADGLRYSQESQQQGGPPSRTNTPAGMMHSSPSLASRQPSPGGGMNPGGAVSENNNNTKIMLIPTSILLQLKRENGLADKDIASLTMVEKVRSVLSLNFSFFSSVTFFQLF